MQVVAHNLAAMTASNELNINAAAKGKSAEKLASGYRINRAADDAAGLQISEKMRRQIRGLDRGVANAREGISACQVADGALAEVHDMLHRLTELSVQAANGTNSLTDRLSIQDEVSEILCEIDRIGETTKFNEIPVFQGNEKTYYDYTDVEYRKRQLSFTDWNLKSVDLGRSPFTYMNSNNEVDEGALRDFNCLNLEAVTNATSSLPGQSWPLVYEAGSTSWSSINLSYSVNGVQKNGIVDADQLTYMENSYEALSDRWSRKSMYTNDDGVNLEIEQQIWILDEYQTDTEKYYTIGYHFQDYSNGSVDHGSVSCAFMFHLDTSYDGTTVGDVAERYAVDGAMVEEQSIYTKPNVSNTFNPTHSNGTGMHDFLPDSFSIYDPTGNAAFTEKIVLDTPTSHRFRPIGLSIGYYDAIRDWNYYNSPSEVGSNAVGEDLGFSLEFANRPALQGNYCFFRYGICAVEADPNMGDMVVAHGEAPRKTAVSDNTLWIQSGCDTGDGIVLRIGAMDTAILEIRDLSVTSEEKATQAIDRIGEALAKISAQRSRIGAQQNRLEHTVDNENNIVENTTVSESRIRDTDMAEEMVSYSKNSILEQAGEAFLTQTVGAAERILQLLQ